MGIIPNFSVINPMYLYSILRSINISIWASEAQPPSMKKTTVEEFEIPLPPLPVQEEIVSEIESYQKIIDGARQVVENYKPRIDIDPEWPIDLHNVNLVVTPLNNPHVGVLYREACVGTVVLHFERDFKHLQPTDRAISFPLYKTCAVLGRLSGFG